MDIRLKSFNITKIIAFILCVVFFIATLTGLAFALRSASNINNVEDVLLSESYQESVGFQQEFGRKVSQLLYVLSEYKSEEYINSGETIKDHYLDSRIRDLFYYKYNNNEGFYDIYGDNYEDPVKREKFKKDFAEEIAEIKEDLIATELKNFAENKKDLDKTEGYSYYATDGTYIITNLNDTEINKNMFTTKPGYLIYEKDSFSKKPASKTVRKSIQNYDSMLKEKLNSEYNPDMKLYMCFDSDYINAKELSFKDNKAELQKWLPAALACALVTLIALIYLIIITGRRDEEGKRPVYKIDRIYTEISLLIIVLVFIFGGMSFGPLLFEGINFGIYYGGILYNGSLSIINIILAFVIGIVSAAIGLLFILSCIRNIKSGRFIKNSIVYIVISSIVQGIKSIYHGGSVMTKVVLVALGLCLLSATIFGAVLSIVLVIVLAPRWVKKYEEIKKGVHMVKNGNLSYKIPTTGDGELDSLARDINQISEASHIAIQNELKNQRLKTDLISNVSHDLKTPLTSIITYIDLLKTEGLDSGNAKQYLDIIDQKSQRLQKLTEDLFDAAKASSGAIPVKFEKVEMLSLINQGLAEMADRIENSQLDFKLNAVDEKYYVKADGQLLWRVLENLLNNVLKYAQENSRVYIDIKKLEKDASVMLEIKNISKNELNIDADELLERFKRGDESRTSEGSGLGLAIAKDLVRLQEGVFEIKIDGDLFKAVIIIPQYL